jgi:hypothetical protein
MSIHINQLLPEGVSIKEFKTGSELLLAHELGKYTQLLLQEDLSVEGINVDKELKSTGHFSYVVKSNFVKSLNHEEVSLAKLNVGDFFPKSRNVTEVAIKFVGNEAQFNFESDPDSNTILRGKNRSAAYVSLMAFVIVKNNIDNKPKRKLVIDHEEYDQRDSEYTDLIELQKGGILPKTILDIKFKTHGVKQLPWENFVKENRAKGHMDKNYSPKEKISFLLENQFEVGDIVLRYTRSIEKDDTIGILTSCYPAVIRGCNEEFITLEYYRTVETKLTQFERMKLLIDKVEELKEFLTPDDYMRPDQGIVTLPLTEVGIGMCTYLEGTFILEPIESDSTVQMFKDKRGELISETLNTIDTIFAVFEDRDVKYNKDKFLQKYFFDKGTSPKFYNYA